MLEGTVTDQHKVAADYREICALVLSLSDTHSVDQPLHNWVLLGRSASSYSNCSSTAADHQQLMLSLPMEMMRCYAALDAAARPIPVDKQRRY